MTAILPGDSDHISKFKTVTHAKKRERVVIEIETNTKFSLKF